MSLQGEKQAGVGGTVPLRRSSRHTTSHPKHWLRADPGNLPSKVQRAKRPEPPFSGVWPTGGIEGPEENTKVKARSDHRVRGGQGQD